MTGCDACLTGVDCSLGVAFESAEGSFVVTVDTEEGNFVVTVESAEEDIVAAGFTDGSSERIAHARSRGRRAVEDVQSADTTKRVQSYQTLKK